MQTFIDTTRRNEEGFVLVLALVTLLLLTLFGIWALNSADFENRVAGHVQQAERTFNMNEGANYAEGSKVVHYRRGWALAIENTHKTHQVMLPEKDGDFDPTGRAAANRELDDALKLVKNDDDRETLMTNPEYWPWDNLEGKYKGDRDRDPASDYHYLVTYLMCDIATRGTDGSGGRVGVASSFKFRIQASAPGQNGVVESATNALGPYQCE